MNIVITLPEHLIKAIMMGEKSCEIRSKLPLYFERHKDVVFVVQKGTKQIPIYFTITTWVDYTKIDDINSLAKNAAVSPIFVEKYRESKRRIYAWLIGCACIVDCPSDLYSDLNIVKNPQSFIYREFEWRKVTFKSFEWLNWPRMSFAALIPPLEHDRYMRSLSSAKPSTL